MKKSMLLAILCMLFWNGSTHAQYRDKVVVKAGINYLFPNKNATAKSALDARVGVVYKTNDYFYVGPQLSMTSLKMKDNSRGTFIELAPVLQFDLISLLYEEVIKPTNTKYLNSSMVFNFGLHFNLDKQAQDERVFNLTRFSLGADFFSRKVFSEGLYLNAESNTYFKRSQLQNSLGLGLGGATKF